MRLESIGLEEKIKKQKKMVCFVYKNTNYVYKSEENGKKHKTKKKDCCFDKFT